MIAIIFALAYIVFFVKKTVSMLKQRKESFDEWHQMIMQVNRELKRIQDAVRKI